MLPVKGSELKVKDKIATIEECESFFVHRRHLEARKPGAKGFYKDWVPGAGGDVWWVEHEDGTTAAYMYDEVGLVEHEGAARRLARGSDDFVSVDIAEIPLEEVREAIAALCAHLRVKLERTAECYGNREYRVVPE